VRDLIWLTDNQMALIEPYFPLSHGVARVDDCKVLRVIVFVIRNGLSLSTALRLSASLWVARCSFRLWTTQNTIQSH
jgi:transposase